MKGGRVLTADNDVLYLQDLNRVLNDRETVQVRVAHHVGDVPVHKDFAGTELQNLFGRNTRVRAT